MMNSYTQCNRCILDTNDDSEIFFDKEGICNHCRSYEQVAKTYLYNDHDKKIELENLVAKIKADGIRKKYDCLLGVSGGVDSTYLAYLAKEYNLRPLLIHFDNGWNSELAVKNIEQICKYTGFDLFTYVVNWEEFKDIQLSYIKASVLDWEVPTDHALYAVLLRKAKELNIKYILSGANYQTEGILPKSMRWDKADLANLKAIHKKFGTKKIKTFPTYGFWWHQYLKFVWGLQTVNILYYIEYNKKIIKEFLINKIGWRDYGGKHYESIFTKFYQGYVLKEKFHVDKRKAHLSSMICSGQISRMDALKELQISPIDADLLNSDIDYFIKKMRITREEFDNIMKAPVRSHREFKSYENIEYPLFKFFLKFCLKIKNALK